jgi:hypothetical protein
MTKLLVLYHVVPHFVILHYEIRDLESSKRACNVSSACIIFERLIFLQQRNQNGIKSSKCHREFQHTNVLRRRAVFELGCIDSKL